MELFHAFKTLCYNVTQVKTFAGLIFDDSRHYIDHLAPLCALHGWPLIVCEEAVLDLARRYYPGLEVIEMNRRDLPSNIIACDPPALVESAIPSTRSRNLLWLPHGNSDKGWKSPIFEPLREKTALVYGQKMIDFIQSQNVFSHMIRIGNFRLNYWLQNRSFYEKIIEKEIPLPKARLTYLYAPTWNDAEGNGSFWETLPQLIANLLKDCNLIVKIHPNTQAQFAPEIERLIGQYAKKANLFFLTEFPPIYPLLSISDAYIGDMSSIGYDFLFWQRPMYFIKSESRSQFLYRCGIEIFRDQIHSIFTENNEERKAIQKQVYAYTFDDYSPLNVGRTKTAFKSLRQ
jgi:teichoic acid glycerol-phosphate primase